LKRICPFWPFALRQHIFLYKTVHFWSDFHILLPFIGREISVCRGVLRNFFDCKLAGPCGVACCSSLPHEESI
jgi:hypothetical protein